MRKIIAITALCSLLLHVLLGWMWSVGGAVIGGYMAGKKGWIVGGVGLAISWGGILVYRLVEAPYQVSEMARVMGALLGNLPPVATYVVSVGIGILLGVAGGAVGSAIRTLRASGE